MEHRYTCIASLNKCLTKVANLSSRTFPSEMILKTTVMSIKRIQSKLHNIAKVI